MKKVHWTLSIILVGILSVSAQAEIAPGGFQGVFGDVESPLEFVQGFTSGSTYNAGIVATINDQAVDLSGFTTDGDPVVMLNNLVLTGVGPCSGSATYVWDDDEILVRAPLAMAPLGAGVISGNLTLQSGSDLRVYATGSPIVPIIPITLPENITAAITYNGVIIKSDGTDGYIEEIAFPSASLTAIHVPEPATIVGLITLGLGMLFVRQRRRK